MHRGLKLELRPCLPRATLSVQRTHDPNSLPVHEIDDRVNDRVTDAGDSPVSGVPNQDSQIIPMACYVRAFTCTRRILEAGANGNTNWILNSDSIHRGPHALMDWYRLTFQVENAVFRILLGYPLRNPGNTVDGK